MENSLLSQYKFSPDIWDEMFDQNGIRPSYKKLVTTLENLSPEELGQKVELAKKLFMSQGITFTV